MNSTDVFQKGAHQIRITWSVSKKQLLAKPSIVLSFMKFVCPHCLARLTFKQPEERLEKIAWLKCPKCLERFKPRKTMGFDYEVGVRPAPTSFGYDNGVRPAPTSWPHGLVNSVISQMDLSRYNKNDITVSDRLDLPSATGQRSWNWLVQPLVCLLLLGSLLGLCFSFQLAAQPLPVIADIQMPEKGYAHEQLLNDMLALKEDMTKLRQINKTIDYSGRESRLIKYYMKLLAPDSCLEFKTIELWSARTVDGFKAKGECLNREPEEILVFSWKADSAVIKVEGKPGMETLNFH
ncbi:MAG: zinc-ribbon domain-containing protein [Deltaproteobacteria bacterium]|jgi:hypothetical protein|nr:zinc-ribbon domain-containing protein [Deltaproteobacteria bacterium]